MANSSNTQLTIGNVPTKTWFPEIKGTSKTALVGGFGHYINTMIMINGSRKLMEISAPTKVG